MNSYYAQLLGELKTLAVLCLEFDLQDEYLEIKLLERDIQKMFHRAV